MKISVSFPFTTKEDGEQIIRLAFWAVPKDKIVRFREHREQRKTCIFASYTQKDIDVWGECVARGLTMAGLYSRRPHSYLLWIWIVQQEGMGLDFEQESLEQMAILDVKVGNTKRQLMCMEDFGATAFVCTPSYALYLAEATMRPES